MEEWKQQQTGCWALSNSGEGGGEPFWDLYMLQVLGIFSNDDYMALVNAGVKFAKKGEKRYDKEGKPYPYAYENQTIYWSGLDHTYPTYENYSYVPHVSALAHELDHAYRWNCTDYSGSENDDQIKAIIKQNKASRKLHEVFGTIVFPCMSINGNEPGLGGGATDPTTACQNAWAAYTDDQVVYGPPRMGIPPPPN